MNNTGKEAANNGWFKRNIIENTWVRILLEIAAFILLVSKLIPETWLKGEWPFLVLITIALAGLLLSNNKLTFRLLSEVSQRENYIATAIGPLQKKARYADVLPMLNAAFQELHNALRRDYDDVTRYHEPFVVFCQNLEKVFSHVTGVECHVCIKMTLFPKGQIPNPNKMEKLLNNLQVKTYCRSSSPSSIRKQIDHNGLTHLINENTDFEYVFKNSNSCFYCPDLATLPLYKNSSFKPYRQGSFIYFDRSTSYEEKVNNWPLNYRSTIVAPIRPIIQEEKYEHNIIGLLCVDSNSPNVFNETLDKHIMIGCADGIYNSFKKLFTVTKPSPTKQNQNDGKQTIPN